MKIQKSNIIDELSYSLDRLVQLHRTLVDLLDEEYLYMGNVDSQALAETALSKEAVVSEIWSTEQYRSKITEEICIKYGFGSNNPTLALIAENLEDTLKKSILVSREVLQLLVGEAREKNQRNMRFAEESLKRIEQLKNNALGISNTSKMENYSSQGVRQPLNEQGGRLLSTEA